MEFVVGREASFDYFVELLANVGFHSGVKRWVEPSDSPFSVPLFLVVCVRWAVSELEIVPAFLQCFLVFRCAFFENLFIG